MKNLIITGLLALLMFSVSAALSMWLQQSKSEAEHAQNDKAEKEKDKEKKKEKHADPDKGREPAEPHSPAKGEHGAGEPAAMVIIRDREAKLDRRAAQVEMVLADLQSQREKHDALVKQVVAEVKASLEKPPEPDPKIAVDEEKKKREAAELDRKNIERMAQRYEAMPPETAASIIKEMADTGHVDRAAKVLAKMKDTKVSKILGELNNTALASQLLLKMSVERTESPPPAPAP